MPRSGADKRRHQRADIDTQVEFSFDGRKWFQGESVDISYQGMLVRSTETAPPDSDVRLRFHIPNLQKDSPVEARSKVARLHQENGQNVGFGVQFVTLSAGDWQALRSYEQAFLAARTRYDVLLRDGDIDSDKLQQAIEISRKEKDPIKGDVCNILIKQFGVPKQRVGASLAEFYQTEFIEFTGTVVVPQELFRGLNEKYLRKNFWVPLAREDERVIVVVDDPANYKLTNEIKRLAQLSEKYEFWVSLREDILQFIDVAMGKHHPTEALGVLPEVIGEGRPEAPSEDEDLLSENAPAIVKLVNRIVKDAFEYKASDIHIEPSSRRKPTVIRFRRDGICFRYTEVPRFTRALINRIKIMANLKLDERRMAQSGKIHMRYGPRDIEVRVEVTPTVGGNEDVVMRILVSSDPIPLEGLNLSPANYKLTETLIKKPYGLVLVVGPTGAGKTTTLHSVLTRLNQPDIKIWTAEDPVEITQEGLRQVQVNPNIGWDFAAAMRSFLRADPDIIMVGEMRDTETARIAIDASLTGHLVLSTLHTNTAPETIARLFEMGLPPINVADGLLGVIAQRLVRTLCPSCKEAYTPVPAELKRLVATYGAEYKADLKIDLQAPPKLYKKKGCLKCDYTGYRGRAGIHEVMRITSALRECIRRLAPVREIKEIAISEGMRTLRMDGIRKILLGQTDMEQVLKITME